jgi:hypothetical protein
MDPAHPADPGSPELADINTVSTQQLEELLDQQKAERDTLRNDIQAKTKKPSD